MGGRWHVNITPAERVGRVLAGLTSLVAAIWLLSNSPSVGQAILEVLLGAAGLDLLITGATGYCPLYRRLGHVPKSLRRSA